MAMSTGNRFAACIMVMGFCLVMLVRIYVHGKADNQIEYKVLLYGLALVGSISTIASAIALAMQ